jgi:hypothetical protein
MIKLLSDPFTQEKIQGSWVVNTLELPNKMQVFP